MNKAIGIFIILAIVSSCKTTKKATVKINDYSKNNFIESVIENNKSIKNLIINYSAVIDDGDNKSNVVGQIRIVKDQLVWVNVNAKIGIELAKALFTTDSIKIIIPSQKILYYSNYDFTNKYFDKSLNLNSIQYALTGSLLSLGTDIITRPQRIETDDSMNLVFKDRTRNFITNLQIDSKTLKPKTIKVSKVTEPVSVEIHYTNFIVINEILLPQVVEVKFINGKNVKRVELQYKKISESDEINIPFKVPEKYKRIGL